MGKRSLFQVLSSVAVAPLFFLSACSVGVPRLNLPASVPRLRVLMIGNSLTYTNNLPAILEQTSATENTPLRVDKITVPLASLHFHWDVGPARRRIANGHYDVVVLQDYSRNPLTQPEDSAKYFQQFSDLAKSSGARVILFENWTRGTPPNSYAELHASYLRIQSLTQGTLAPIGTAWEMYQHEHPEVRLLADDRHPTAAGSYLAACVLYDALYHKKSAGLPENLRAPRLPVGMMQTLRQTADAVANP